MLFRSLFLILALTACGSKDNDNAPLDQTIDKDGDGFSFEEDCNDNDPSFYPGAPETCDEPLVDSNCDGMVGGLDRDEDGFPACEDCDDVDPNRNPIATEVCDGIDNDCDGDVDDDDPTVDLSTAPLRYLDEDDDGFGDDEQPIVQCDASENVSEEGGDCDDKNPDIHPNAEEVCDLVDNNCNGLSDRDDDTVIIQETDPVCYTDDDNDGFGEVGSEGLHTCFCVTGEVDNEKDCNDSDSGVNPDAEYSTEPASDGTWDLNCDENIDKEYPDAGAYCLVGSDGRSCDFEDGFVGSSTPECGESGVFMTTCKPKKSTSGLICETTDEYRTQACW